MTGRPGRASDASVHAPADAGGTSGATAAIAPFRIGQSAPANTFLAIWMARDAGYDEANGLRFEIVPMTGGRDIADAFAAGRIDAMHIGLSSVVRANAAGADLRAFGSLSNVIRFALFGGRGLTRAEDLRGGTIGVSSFGSESDATLALVLREIGLTRADLTIRECGRDRLAALDSRAIDSSAVNEPDRSRAYAAGLTALVDLAPRAIPWLFTGLVAPREALVARRESFLRFLRATIEGNRLALADPARAREVLRRELRIEDKTILDVVAEDFRAQTPRDAEISIEAARAIVAEIAPPGASRDIADYVDLTLGEELRARPA